MTPRQHELAARLACLEALKNGCTTLCEFFYTDQAPELAHACIEEIRSTGIRSEKELFSDIASEVQSFI